jgi:hypothetical protein
MARFYGDEEGKSNSGCRGQCSMARTTSRHLRRARISRFAVVSWPARKWVTSEYRGYARGLRSADGPLEWATERARSSLVPMHNWYRQTFSLLTAISAIGIMGGALISAAERIHLRRLFWIPSPASMPMRTACQTMSTATSIPPTQA